MNIRDMIYEGTQDVPSVQIEAAAMNAISGPCSFDDFDSCAVLGAGIRAAIREDDVTEEQFEALRRALTDLRT